MRRALVLLLALAAACGGGGGGGGTCTGDCSPPPEQPPPTGVRPAWPTGRPAGYRNPIPAENAFPGEPSWKDGSVSGARLEAYADRVSARAGQTVRVQASADAARTARWVVYRIGWYGGAGARRVLDGGPVAVGPQPACAFSPDTGLLRCAWATAFSFAVTPDMRSGYYAVKLVRDDGWITFVPLVVVDDRPADLLVQAATDTWQAYNPWGGESLYQDASGLVPGGLGMQVSFDRPYAGAKGLGQSDDHELAFARFLERYGYDVTYTTDVNTAYEGADHLLRAGAFLSVGHDEYWNGAVRDAVEAARDRGMPLLFLGANAGYWKTRYEAEDGAGNPRIITCHKATPDPIAGPDTTGRYRDPAIDRPENALVGAMYESWEIVSHPLVVADASSWLYEGTGLRDGDALPLLVGHEYDVTVENGAEPPGTTVVARSPVLDAEGKPGWATTVHYRAASGALVFAAGTIQWARGVDPGRAAYDPRVERMTANAIHAALGLPVPDGIAVGSAGGATRVYTPPAGPFARAVGTLAQGLAAPTGVTVLPDGALAVADPRRHQIFRVERDGSASVLAGDGVASRNAAFDGVPGAQARFFAPTAVLALPDGSVLVADTNNACIRRIANDAAHTVTTFAGEMGKFGFADGQGKAARFRFPMGLARDPVTGRVLVADSANHRIRAIAPDGTVTTLAGAAGGGDADGPGATARFAYPTAVAAAPDGRVFVVNTSGGRVKAIGTDPARTVTTLVLGGEEGARDGDGTSALLSPQGGAAFAGGVLYVSEPANYRVRAIAPGADAATTTVHTLAGTGGFGATDGAGNAARFRLPAGLAAAPDGTLYLADPGNGAVRTVAP